MLCMEGYSRTISVEVESDGAGYRFPEGFEGSPVVGVQDSPGLQVGDNLLDNPPDFVDLAVVFLLPRRRLPVRRLLVRCQHAVTDVPVVADPVSRLERDQDTGVIQGNGVVARSVDGIRHPCPGAVQGAGDRNAQTGRLVPTGVPARVRRPGPAWRQAASHEVPAGRLRLIRCGNVPPPPFTQDRGQCRDRSTDRGLRHLEGYSRVIL